MLLFAGEGQLMGQAAPVAGQSAPIPAQIIAARSAFLANAGSTPANNQFALIAYNTLYQELTKANRYRLTGAPTDADLIFEVSVHSFFEGQLSYAQYVQLVIRDPKSQSLLWSTAESIPIAAREKTLEKNLADAATKLAADLGLLASGNAAAPTPAAAPKKERFSEEK
jgi:hypothetical protein